MSGAGGAEKLPAVDHGGGPVVVLSAMREELLPLARRLRAARRERLAGLAVRRAEVAGRTLVLAVGGVGRRAAAGAARRLIEAVGPRALLGLGAAGGLTPDLAAGAVVWSQCVVDEEGGAWRPPEWRWTSSLERLAGARGATVLTVRRVVGEAEDKRRLARQLSEPGPAIVDLESSAWAAAAAEASVPWLVLRAVSDTADESLPFDAARVGSRDGGVSRARLLAHGLVRPALLLRLPELRRRLGTCAHRLAEAAEELLRR